VVRRLFSAPTLCYVAQFQPCAEVRQSGETERQPKGCGMAENKLKGRWKAGKAAVNGWLAIPSEFSAEVMAQCGWDSVTVDMQHGVQDYQTMVQCF
jgi:4-hydroxy-2-oxoheptanedioate aldolase